MNIPPYIQIDPLTGVLAAIAILYSIYALYYTRRQEQRNACFRLLELWSSDYYSQCRNEGWYELEALTSPIEMNDLQDEPYSEQPDLGSGALSRSPAFTACAQGSRPAFSERPLQR